MARILLADDDAHIVRVMSIWLNRQGHQTIITRNGKEALERIERGDADMLISDMNMPLLDGLELAKTIRKKGLTDLPIIVLTARCDQNKLSAEMNPLGVHVCPKPFMPSKLVLEIERLLGVVAEQGAV